jgi:hypothetical protein
MSTFPEAGSKPSGNRFFTYTAVYGRKIPLEKPEKIYYTAETQRAQRDKEAQRDKGTERQRKDERRTSNEKQKKNDERRTTE